MEVGYYVGDGVGSRVINVGFTPKAVWVYPSSIGAPNVSVASAMATMAHMDCSQSYEGGVWERQIAYFGGIDLVGFKTGTHPNGYGINKANVHYFWIAVKM